MYASYTQRDWRIATSTTKYACKFVIIFYIFVNVSNLFWIQDLLYLHYKFIISRVAKQVHIVTLGLQCYSSLTLVNLGRPQLKNVFNMANSQKWMQYNSTTFICSSTHQPQLKFLTLQCYLQLQKPLQYNKNEGARHAIWLPLF